MLLQGYVSNTDDNYTQNYDKNGNIYYTDENGRVVDFKVNPFVKLANKVKATAINIGNWLNESNPNSEAYKQKVGLVAGLVTAPLGIGELATAGVTRALAPYVGRKIAQNMATGLGSGVVGGGVSGGLEAGLNDRNIAIGGLQGATVGGLLGGLGGYGLGKIAQKLNTQTAWHGSPYKFDKFSNDAIGTGEGAQAHGYGHYAAKDKSTAEAYAKNLSEGNKVIEYNGVPYKSVDEFKPNEYNYKLLADIKSDGLEATRQGLQEERQWALGKLEKSQDKSWWEDYLQEIDKKENLLNDLDPNLLSDIRPDTGNLYKLSIPKDDVMLREGARLDKQPKIVQDAFNQIRQEYLNLEPLEDNKTLLNYFGDKLGNANDFYEKQATEAAIKVLNGDRLSANEWQYLNNLNYEDLHKLDAYFTNGEDILKRLQNHFYDKNNKEQLAQKILYNKGIKGISYNGGIDGEARVIFNPDDIDIIPYYDNPTSFKEKFINLLSR